MLMAFSLFLCQQKEIIIKTSLLKHTTIKVVCKQTLMMVESIWEWVGEKVKYNWCFWQGI